MRLARRSIGLLVLAALVQLSFVREAQAYLDAGTGSFIFQSIVALLAGAAVALRMYWQRIKAFFSRQAPAAEEAAAEKSPGDDG